MDTANLVLIFFNVETHGLYMHVYVETRLIASLHKRASLQIIRLHFPMPGENQFRHLHKIFEHQDKKVRIDAVFPAAADNLLV